MDSKHVTKNIAMKTQIIIGKYRNINVINLNGNVRSDITPSPVFDSNDPIPETRPFKEKELDTKFILSFSILDINL